MNMAATVPLNPLNLQSAYGTINWRYFFGGVAGNTSTRFYFATINGLRVEKREGGKTLYAIGNFDRAKKKFKTEVELIKALGR